MLTECSSLMSGNLVLDVIKHTTFIMFAPVAFIGLGFFTKGTLGAILGFAFGVIGFLYWNQMSPF